LHHRGAHELVSAGFVAVGWPDAGDLTGLVDDRDQFKARMAERFPSKSAAWVANAAGQLLRFRHVMEVGDLLVYSRKADRTINIGRIAGDYEYQPDAWPRYPNRRKVDWLKTEIPRDTFSSGCLYEIGSALSVFTIKEHRRELQAILGDATPPPQPTVGDVVERALAPVSEDEPDVERISELTGDYLLKVFNTDLKGHDFARFCGWLFEALGYSVRVSPPGADGGIDVIATKDPLGVTRPLLKVQCKSGSGRIGSSDVQALNGTLAGSGELGVFIAVGDYTAQARRAADGMPKMHLVGPDELLELVLSHYQQLPDDAKQAIPLRRVWMPDRPSASD